MSTFRVSAAAAVVGAILTLTGQVSAMGLGRATQRAVLGENLAMSVPVRLDSGEDLSSECVAADVFFGDDKLAPQQVSVSLEGAGPERTLRIATRTVVNEPVVSVYAVVGCQSRISRKFVAFADPPALDPVLQAEAPSPAVTRLTPKARTAEPSSAARTWSNDTGLADARTEPRRTKAVDAGAPTDASSAPVRPSNPASRRPGPRPTEARIDRAPASPPVARLVLDPVEADALVVPGLQWSMGMEAPAETPEVIQRRAAAAALWAALNASPEQLQQDRQRLEDLQARLTALQKQLSDAQGRIDQVQSDAPTLERVLKHPLVQGLAVLVLALLAALVWAWRRQPAAASADWWQAAEPADLAQADGAETGATLAGPSSGSPAPEAPAGRQPVYPAGHPRAAVLAPAPAPAPAPAAATAGAQPATGAGASPGGTTPDASAFMRTMAIQLPVAQEAPRELSVEELIDLEQQAEFFVVLGQDDAAIELLESHVQSAGAVSPLPYLKLLELYRRLDRHDDYERAREVFNARFNAYAPAWLADPQEGHHLEDYPGVIGRLQGLWNRPAKAMEVIGASLLRADESHETFDLPAYRELLFLYSVARDLAERPHLRPDDAPVSAYQELEPLMATRPVRAAPQALPPLSIDLPLDEPARAPLAEADSHGGEVADSGHGHVIEFENVDFKRPGA